MISYEIIVEEQIQHKTEASNQVLEKYIKRKKTLQLKFISNKFLNGLISGLLPLIPLIAYS